LLYLSGNVYLFTFNNKLLRLLQFVVNILFIQVLYFFVEYFEYFENFVKKYIKTD